MALRSKSKAPKPGTRELPPRDRTRKADRALYDELLEAIPVGEDNALPIEEIVSKVGRQKSDVLAATLTAGRVRMAFATNARGEWYRP